MMVDDTVEKFWDNCHKRNVIPSLTGAKYDNIINKALKLTNYIEYGKNVLEVGPGLGYVTEGLYKNGMNVSCLDISKVALERVSKYCEKIYTTDDLDKLPSNYFDIIMCVNVIQHIPTALLTEEIKHCMRSLRVGGVFALEFVSSNVAEDTGIDACIRTVKGGLCCRSVSYMEELLESFGGVCELIIDIKCNSSGITGCHTFHVRRGE